MENTKVEFLTREEEAALVKKALKGDVDARNKIIMAIWPLICREANAMGKRYERDPDDLAQIGLAQCLEFFHRFDPKKGFRASTYFVKVAWSEMWKVCQWDFVVSLPKGCHITPNNQDAAARARSAGTLQSKVAVGSDGAYVELGDTIPDKSTLSHEEAARHEDVYRLNGAIKKLPERLQEVLAGRMRGDTLQTISESMGITRERVRQLEQKAHEKIAAALS